MSTSKLVNKIGPRKLKSWPLLEAQKVYPVRPRTTADVKIKASSTILPVITNRKKSELSKMFIAPKHKREEEEEGKEKEEDVQLRVPC